MKNSFLSTGESQINISVKKFAYFTIIQSSNYIMNAF